MKNKVKENTKIKIGVKNDPEKVYTYDVVDGVVESVKIEDTGNNNVQINILTTTNARSVESKSPVTVNCDNANIKLQSNSENINIIGTGTIKISSDKEDGITLGTVRLDEATSPLEGFNSPNNDLTIKELDIFGNEEFSGDNTKSLKCETAKLEGGSTFKATKMTIEDIKVGLNSLLQIDSDDDVNITNFKVAYNTSNTNPPIIFSGTEKSKYPKLSESTISLFNHIQGAFLDDTVESTIIAQFQGDASEEKCKELAGNYNKGDTDFNNAECIPDGTTKCNLVAKRSVGSNNNKDDDDGGLSAGAIAGIVIACVVVVAAIIALLVYFLVIKKRKQSTTSTQGDSSIAI